MFELHIVKTNIGWNGVLHSARGIRKIILSCKAKSEIFLRIDESYSLIEHDLDYNSLDDLCLRLVDYLNGCKINFPDTLDTSHATKFQKQVWELTRTIPYGETRSYAWVSEKLGFEKRAVRPVGYALGRNPLPIIIPCHRVIGSNGHLVGFSAGLGLKKYLLNLENIDVEYSS